MSTPSTYKDATRLPAGAKTAQREAAFTWADLTKKHPARANALRYCDPLRPMWLYRGGPRRVTLDAMVLDGLLSTVPHVKDHWYLTGWGHSVREAGTRTPKGQDDG